MSPSFGKLQRIATVVATIAAIVLATNYAAAASLAQPPLAYVGPGAGLGAIGALLAVLGAILIGVAGLVLYPLQLFRNWIRKERETAGETHSDGSGA
jgi:hypothetical protein